MVKTATDPFGSRTHVDDLAAILEHPFLGHVEVSAELDARGDGPERVQETTLAAVTTRGCQVGQAGRAGMGQQDIDGSLPGDLTCPFV